MPSVRDYMSDLMAGFREDAERYWRECRALAIPDCRICRGWGYTQGYIGPSKFAQYPCACTGRHL
jgi:hypothetical protein